MLVYTTTAEFFGELRDIAVSYEYEYTPPTEGHGEYHDIDIISIELLEAEIPVYGLRQWVDITTLVSAKQMNNFEEEIFAWVQTLRLEDAA